MLRSCLACFIAACILACPAGLAAGEPAALALPGIFSDRMVLQQGMPVPIWGTAPAGTEVVVRFRGQSRNARAGADGRWLSVLEPLLAEPGQKGSDLIISAGNDTRTIADVLVGEVWFGSGQSNMEWTCAKAARAEDIAAADMPGLRLFVSTAKDAPLAWQECSPATATEFSALMVYMGRRLRQDISVPIGMFVAATGNTATRRWITNEDFMADPVCKQTWLRYAAEVWSARMQELQALPEAQRSQARMKLGLDERQPNPNGPGNGGEFYKVRPFVGYAIRGMVWDQGEAGSGIYGLDWEPVMRALITGWRRAWGQDFPVLYVQKPSGGGRAFAPATPRTPAGPKAGADPWLTEEDLRRGFERERFLGLVGMPGVAMCIAQDLNGLLHPTPKDRYGTRLAELALGKVYGAKVPWQAPLLARFEVVGGRIRLDFATDGSGLATPGTENVRGFAIAGGDRRFAWAEAVREGDTIWVSSSQVPAPVAVRYAWGSAVGWANLFGGNGLPVVSFRTDEWPRSP